MRGSCLYRLAGGPGGSLEVLLAHPGGPYFAKKDLGDWTIPKGEPDADETDLTAVARREFEDLIPASWRFKDFAHSPSTRRRCSSRI